MRPVSFDFDGTLSKPVVQEYCAELMARGHDVWVVTSRFDMLNVHRYADPAHNNHDDLWAVCDSLGIPRWKVVFTNFTSKADYLRETKVLWHLDDDFLELSDLKHSCPGTLGIQVNSGSWRSKCERIINNEKKR